MIRYLMLLIVAVSLSLSSCKENNPEDPENILSISPSSVKVPNLDDETIFYIAANDKWEVNYDSDWFSIVPVTGTGDGEITVTYTSILDSARAGSFTVSASGHEPESIIVPFSQASEPGLKISPTILEIPAESGTVRVRVIASGNWNVIEDIEWVTLNGSSGDGDGSFEVDYFENTRLTQRLGNIAVTAPGHYPETITLLVKQSEVLPRLSVVPLHRDVDADSEGAPFTVNAEGSWTAHPDIEARWVTDIAYEEGYFRVLYPPNDGAPRTVEITVLADGHFPSEVAVSLTQAGSLGEPPEQPGNLSATKVYWDQIDLLWTDESDFEDGFKIVRRSQEDSWETIDELDPNSGSYSDQHLRSRFSYTYKVIAFNSFGDSEPTDELTVVTHSPLVSARLNGEALTGEIEYNGDADWFAYKVDTPSNYVFFTELLESELTDTRIWLYGADSRTRLIEFDDNSGSGKASRISHELSAGIHFVKVEAVNLGDSGSYMITAQAE